jgi:hypothetical protein
MHQQHVLPAGWSTSHFSGRVNKLFCESSICLMLPNNHGTNYRTILADADASPQDSDKVTS